MSKLFWYVMSEIFLGQMRTKTKSVSKSGVGLEAASLKRILMYLYLALVNVQRNIFDKRTDDEELDVLTQSTEQSLRMSNKPKSGSGMCMKENENDLCSA